MNKILIIITKHGSIPTSFRSKTLALAILMSNPYPLIDSPIFMGRKVDITRFLVITIDIGHNGMGIGA